MPEYRMQEKVVGVGLHSVTYYVVEKSTPSGEWEQVALCTKILDAAKITVALGEYELDLDERVGESATMSESSDLPEAI